MAGVTLVVAGVATAAAWPGGELDLPSDAVTVREASAPGFTDDVVATVLVGQPLQKSGVRDGAVVLVREDGGTDVVVAPELGALGGVAMNARGGWRGPATAACRSWRVGAAGGARRARRADVSSRRRTGRSTG